MDCDLPGMNGYEATAEIRRHESIGKHIRVIALTAIVSEDQKERCLDTGMDGYLAKPVNLQLLADNLDACSRIDTTLAHNPGPARSGKAGEQLDPAVLAEIAELSRTTGRNVFRKLADIFLSDLSRHVHLITAALESSNMSLLALVIHQLIEPCIR